MNLLAIFFFFSFFSFDFVSSFSISSSYSIVSNRNNSNPSPRGENLYLLNCAVCHPLGKNLILPEKNLKKESLEATGMNSLFSLSYQIRNGKNGMPAFGDRLTQEEIQQISLYILKAADKNFENR